MIDLKTLKTRLTETEQAISRIKLGGQEVQTRVGRVRLPDLTVLLQEKADLERQISEVEQAEESGVGAAFTTPVVFYGKR